MFDKAILNKYFVGWDKVFDALETKASISNYPPFNICKKSDKEYTIELAVAGFSKSDLDIELSGDNLIIKGNGFSEDSGDYLWKGIGLRPFTHKFKLNENFEVTDAQLDNGMLKITLEYIIPEDQKPTKIQITGAK